MRLGDEFRREQSGRRFAWPADGAGVYAEPGYLLFQRGDALHAIRFDPARAEVSGEPITLADKPGGLRNYAGSTPLTASPTGVIVYPEGLSTTELSWFDRQGDLLEVLSLPPDQYSYSAISPDGSRVALTRPSRENGTGIWMIDLDRTVATRLTFAPLGNDCPVWSADSRHLVFSSMREGSRNIYVKNGSGTEPPRLLLRMEGSFSEPMGWSRDGTALLVRDLKSGTINDVYIYYPGEERLEPLLNSRFQERGPSISHDGNWLAYYSNESGQDELYVQPFPDLGAKYQVSTEGAGSVNMAGLLPPLWKPDGTELIFLNRDALTLMVVPIQYEPSFRAGRPEPLFKMPARTRFFTSIDNQRFLLSVEKGGTWNFAEVTNWTADLEGREQPQSLNILTGSDRLRQENSR